MVSQRRRKAPHWKKPSLLRRGRNNSTPPRHTNLGINLSLSLSGARAVPRLERAIYMESEQTARPQFRELDRSAISGPER